METKNIESVLLNILKRLMIIVIGSGLVTNAMYIYGLAYYQGYIEGVGFQYSLFSIPWDEALLWTYSASRELGASTIVFWTTFTKKILVVGFVSVYMLVRLWLSITDKKEKNIKENKGRFSSMIRKCLLSFKKSCPLCYKIIFIPTKWLILKEQALWAFIASYFFFLVLVFLPIFIFIWVYFPIIGLEHGKKIANKRLIKYTEGSLCGDTNDYWDKCINLSTSHIKESSLTLPEIVRGRLIIKKGSLIALLTKDGPITMTLPSSFYNKTIKNRSFISQKHKASNK